MGGPRPQGTIPGPDPQARDGEADVGVDTKGVRRSSGALVLPYAKGSHRLALRTAKSAGRLRRARRLLDSRIYAESSKKPRASRLATLRRLLRGTGRPFLPITAEAMRDVAAALLAGRYRSTANFLADWRKAHVEAGHPWTERLIVLRRDLLRASARGQGPPKRAATFGAERLPLVPDTRSEPITRGGPRWPWLLITVGVCWLLREAELADLLREQASIVAERREATLNLSATKMDTAGTGCLRTLGCICDSGLQGPCPYCALAAVLAAGAGAGLGPKDPLFPTRGGKAPEKKSVVRTLRRLLRMPASGHTLRREGAQMLARRGVFLYLIQFLGRWGGPTVARYVDEALRGQLARAASSSAAGGAGGPFGTSRAELRTTLQELVDEAVARRAAEFATDSAAGAPDPLHAVLTAAPAVPGAPNPPPAQQVRGLKGGREVGEVHEVALADPTLPKAVWSARCPWRFGLAPHVLLTGREVTCARCISRRMVDLRKLAIV